MSDVEASLYITTVSSSGWRQVGERSLYALAKHLPQVGHRCGFSFVSTTEHCQSANEGVEWAVELMVLTGPHVTGEMVHSCEASVAVGALITGCTGGGLRSAVWTRFHHLADGVIATLAPGSVERDSSRRRRAAVGVGGRLGSAGAPAKAEAAPFKPGTLLSTSSWEHPASSARI